MSNLTLSEFILENYGININPPINKVTRFAAADKPKSKSCWVRNFGEIAVMNNWRDDKKALVWRSEQTSNHIKKMSQFDRKRYFAELNAQIARTEAEAAIEKQAYITEYWTELSPITSQNPYFVRKKIGHQPDFKQDEDFWCVPLYSIQGKVVGIQRLNDNGKYFVKGSTTKLTFYPIRLPKQKLISCKHIFTCEGYATGASLYIMLQWLKSIGKIDNFSVVVAFSSNNVRSVYDLMRINYPKANIIHCADNDKSGLDCCVNLRYFNFEGVNNDASDIYLKNANSAVNELWEKIKDMI